MFFHGWKGHLGAVHTHNPSCTAVAMLLWLHCQGYMFHRGHHAATVLPCPVTTHNPSLRASCTQQLLLNALNHFPFLRCRWLLWHPRAAPAHRTGSGHSDPRRRPAALHDLLQRQACLRRGVRPIPPNTSPSACAARKLMLRHRPTALIAIARTAGTPPVPVLSLIHI